MPPKPRRRRWWRWLVLAVVLLGVSIAVLPYGVAIAPVRSFVARRIGEQLRGPCAIERLSWSWSTGLHVEGLEIGNPPGFPTERPALRVRRMTADVALGSLASKQPRLTASVDGLEVFVEQRADGTTNLQELGPRGASPPAPEPPPPAPPPTPNPPKRPPADRPQDGVRFDLTLRGGLVEIRREGALLETLRDLTVDVHGVAPDDVSATAKAALTAGDVQFHASGAPTTGDANFGLECRGLDLARLEPLVATFAPGQVTALAGKAEGQLTGAARGGERVELAGSLRVTDCRLAGPIVRDMDLRSAALDIGPQLVIDLGETPSIDAEHTLVRTDWMQLSGVKAEKPGTLRFDYMVDLQALAAFGGPMPAMLRDGAAVVTGTLDLPARDLPRDAAGWTKAIALSGKLTATGHELAGFSLDSLTVDAALRDGICKLTAAPPSQLDGGPVRADVQIDLTDFARMPMTATLGWQGGKLTGGAAQALRYAVPLFAGLDAAAAGVSGDCDLQMTLNGPALKADGQSWLAWLDQWSGNGSLGLRNAAFAPAQQLQGLLAPLGQLSRAVAPLGLLSEGLAPLGDQGKLAIDSFTAPFAFAQGVVRTTAGEWLAKGQRIGLSGAVGFDGALDYALDLTALLKGHKDGERVLQALSGALPPAKLVGTLDAPRLGLPELGDVAKKLLEGELKQKAEDLLKKQAEDLLKKGLEDLFKKKKQG